MHKAESDVEFVLGSDPGCAAKSSKTGKVMPMREDICCKEGESKMLVPDK
jgi:hypothetical protein